MNRSTRDSRSFGVVKSRSIDGGEERSRDSSRCEIKRSRIWTSEERGRVLRESWREIEGNGSVDSNEESKVLGSSAFSSLIVGVVERRGEDSSEEKR